MSSTPSELQYMQYHGSQEATYLNAIRQLISGDLSEPYSALDGKDNLVGVVISKLEPHRGGPLRGYIAMLAVREEFRGKGIATKLVCMAVDAMIEQNADEIALETEVTNTAAMKLYERLGFLKSKKLHRYYLNGNSAFRFLLYLKEHSAIYDEEHDIETRLPEPPPSA
ncbi:N-alpha-acetyltransferase 30 [Lecanora helva]